MTDAKGMACPQSDHLPAVCAQASLCLSVVLFCSQREEARLARLERERQQQEAERAARQEAQCVAKEQLRERARAAKEKAERVPVCLL